MTLTGMKKHVGVLEQAGLVTTAEARFDELDKVVEGLKRKERGNDETFNQLDELLARQPTRSNSLPIGQKSTYSGSPAFASPA
jgi:hypothetical protein